MSVTIHRLQERGLEFRKESRIYYLRNLNNWIKSMLIQDYSQKVRVGGSGGDLVVLDIGRDAAKRKL